MLTKTMNICIFIFMYKNFSVDSQYYNIYHKYCRVRGGGVGGDLLEFCKFYIVQFAGCRQGPNIRIFTNSNF